MTSCEPGAPGDNGDQVPYVSPVPRTRGVLRNSCCSRWTVVSRTYFEAGFASRFDRSHGIASAISMWISASRGSVPQLPVGGFVATRLVEEGTQPQHRELSRF